MNSAKTRSAAIDLVRVVAIIGVVARHTWYDPDGIVAQVVCPWAIAVFFVLSGYLWKADRALATEVRNRWRGLLIPYAVWVPLIAIPYFIWAFHEYDPAFAATLVVGVGYGGKFAVAPFSACWFFTTMFFAAVYMRYLERYSRRVTWLVIVLTLVVTCTAPLALKYGPLGMTLALPCMLFIVLGQELRSRRDRINRPGLVGLGLVGVGAVAVALGASHDLNGDLIEIKNSMYGYPIAGLVSGALIGLGLILLAESCDPFVPKAVRPGITEAASTATFVMFLHPCILFLMRGAEAEGSWPQFLLALFVPYALGTALIRMRALPWLTGVWAPRQPSLPVST